MEIKQLEYFVNVVDAASFSRASDRLGIAQPALSRSIAQLERELDTPLLHRHGRGVRVTEAGSLMYEHATALLHQSRKITESIKDKSLAVQGQVTVGMPTGIAQSYAAQLVRNVLTTAPQIKLTVREALSWHLEEQLLTGALDMAVLYDNAPASPLSVMPIARLPLFLVGKNKSSSSAIRGRSISLTEIVTLGLFIPSRPHAIRRTVDEAFVKLGATPNVIAEIDGTSAILELVADGLGYAILTEPTFRLASRPERFLSQIISKPNLSTKMVLAHAKARPITRAQKTVYSVLEVLLGAGGTKTLRTKASA